METQLLRRVFEFNSILMFFFSLANAQIVYTDVNPDTTLVSGGYKLDLNKDGVIDFTLTNSRTILACACISGSSGTARLKSNSLNSVADHSPGFAAKFNAGEMIGSSLNWSNQDSNVLGGSNGSCSFTCPLTHGKGFQSHQVGSWSNDSDKYLGLKIQVAGNIYYGWARLNTGYLAQFITIKDYAFNSIPDQSIFAGQLPCPLPRIRLENNGPSSFCTGDSVELTANLPGEYQWKRNGNNISDATLETHTVKTAGKYRVTITNNGCSKTSAADTVAVHSCLSLISLLHATQQLAIIPNQATNKITLFFSSPDRKEIQITNMLGQIIFSEVINSAKAEIDVSRFPKGIYVVSLRADSQILVVKFLKQ